MKDKKLLANFSSLLFSNFSVQGLRFLTIILLTRKLGPELFGVYNYILLLVSLCAVVVEFGLRNYAIREFSLGKGTRKTVIKIFTIRAVISIFSMITVGLLSYQAFRSLSLVTIALIFSVSLFIDAFLMDFVAVAQEKLHLLAFGQVLQAAFYLIPVYFLLNNFADLTFIAIAFSVSHLFWILPFFFGISKIPKENNHHLTTVNVFWGGLPFLVATLFATLQSQMDIFLLGQFHFNHLLGDYSACLKLLAIPLGVVNSLIASVQPRIAQNIEKSDEVLKLLKKYLKPLLIFVFAMNFAFLGFGKNIIHLFFGEKYSLSILYLNPLTLVTSVFIITLLPMHALFVSHQTKKLLKITLFNFSLSFIVIAVTLYLKQPLHVPWAMLFVQCVCCYQAWRHFLKK